MDNHYILSYQCKIDMEEIKVMKKIYKEPKLEIIKFSIEERIMTNGDDGEFPSVNASDITNPFPLSENDTL